MDGVERGLRSSLQFRLSAWLSLAIIGVALVGGAASFGLAFREAIELQDDQLRQMAAIADRLSLPLAFDTLPDTDIEARLVVQLLRPAVANAPALPAVAGEFPATLVDGLQTTLLEADAWRVFVKPLASGGRIAVGQRTALRDEIAIDGALRTLAPFLVLVPILLLLVRQLVGQMLAPLKQMASDLDRRHQQDLQPLGDSAVPTEIRPFVVAIDRLLARVAQSVAMQQRFIADAAHELRSPMTALSLQAEQLEAVDIAAPARQRLTALRGGIQRTRELLDQLLTLARVQEPPRGDGATESLRGVLRHVLEDLMPLADAKGIDIGVEGNRDARVRGHAVDLGTLAKNLVDNAIRYTPPGGRIDLHISEVDGRGVLQVDDSGPGIAPAERLRVFDPFYRVLGSDQSGSGLGLSIVKAIADRLGATIALHWADEPSQRGLSVRVVFPAAAPN